MIGTIIGSFAIGKPSDVFGRKNALFVLAVCFFASALGCGLARSWGEFLAARFLGGLAIGGVSMVTPMYIAEISPPRLRGRLVMVNQLNIVVGILLSYISNYVIEASFGSDTAWRWMLGISCRSLLYVFCALFSPSRKAPAAWCSAAGRRKPKGFSNNSARKMRRASWPPSKLPWPKNRASRKSGCSAGNTGARYFSPGRWPRSANSPASMRCSIMRWKFSKRRWRCGEAPCCNLS